MQAIDASENVDFNLHTHVECNSPLLPDSKTIVISTHALTWSATPGERRAVMCCGISTHALTWSATISLLILNINTRISTHALTWSATFLPADRYKRNQFQLTHSRGVRRFDHSWTDGIRKFQLTHSRGVRQYPISYDSAGNHFNSRTHVECDHGRPYSGIQRLPFQLTHSRGVRHGLLISYNDILNFNSRTHVECDSESDNNDAAFQIFQLTHSRGVRLLAEQFLFQCGKFQLTHSRGVRQVFVVVVPLNLVISTHALTWSATRFRAGILLLLCNFNSRTHVECDQGELLALPRTFYFNSRTHVECDSRALRSFYAI